MKKARLIAILAFSAGAVSMVAPLVHFAGDRFSDNAEHQFRMPLSPEPPERIAGRLLGREDIQARDAFLDVSAPPSLHHLLEEEETPLVVRGAFPG